MADKKLTITFGPSQDPEGVIMVDSIKMFVIIDIILFFCFLLYILVKSFITFNRYGKTKDAFGWPEETEEILPGGQSTSAHIPAISNETDNTIVSPAPLSSIDRLVLIYKYNSLN